MKSIVLTHLKQLEIKEVPKPQLIGDDDVLLKVGAVGVCGSDIHYFAEGRIGDQVVNFPFVIGHECSAIVESIGKNVKKLKPGDKVAVEPAVSCGKCDQCQIGRFNTCRKLRFLGCPGQLEGCLSEYIIMPAENCFLLNPELTLSEGALIEPLSIGAYAVSFLENSRAEKVTILGAGPIGLSVLLSVKSKGEKTIFVTDKIDRRLEAAREIGADWSGNPENVDIVERIRDAEPLLMDAVFECCGKQEALDQAIDLLKPGGKLIMVGIPSEDRVDFDVSKMRRKEIVIQNVRRQNMAIADAIKVLEENRTKAGLMITHNFSLFESQKAFELVAGYKDGVIKAMIRFE
ncbi:MAG: zinc-dependent alcohol dehydrogenase [Ignavibacteriales bacterium]